MTGRWARAGLGFGLAMLCVAAAPAKQVTVEFLQGSITPKTIGALAGLACRNYDHIVHLDISVNWPAKSSDVEISVVDGEIVMENFRLTRIDSDQVLRDVQTALPQWAEKLVAYGGSVVGAHFHDACCGG